MSQRSPNAIFECYARLRLRSRDEDDWPVLVTALALACGVWTEDADFFGTGITMAPLGVGYQAAAWIRAA